MVPIDRKFNKEQLLPEIFFPKMHIERDVCKKLISGGFKLPLKKSSRWRSKGFNTLFRTSFSNIFHTQTFAGSFCKFSPHFYLICLDYLEIFRNFDAIQQKVHKVEKFVFLNAVEIGWRDCKEYYIKKESS